jgi:hypothetical protein
MRGTSGMTMADDHDAEAGPRQRDQGDRQQDRGIAITPSMMRMTMPSMRRK